MTETLKEKILMFRLIMLIFAALFLTLIFIIYQVAFAGISYISYLVGIGVLMGVLLYDHSKKIKEDETDRKISKKNRRTKRRH